MRVGLCQLNSSDRPDQNLPEILAAISRCADQGAELVLTPEVTNCVSSSRAHQQSVLVDQNSDPVLAAVRELARQRGIHVLIGSLALQSGDPDGRFANRSFLIGPGGEIITHYDKIHMFDVDLGAGETYRESAGYRPGDRAVVADTALGKLGLSICYDMRFGAMYRDLAKGGAAMIAVPAAFTRPTGQAHWHVLLRARAIETGCFVLAPAQCGVHAQVDGKHRATYGHSLVVSPWGEVLADAGDLPGEVIVDIDLDDGNLVRQKIPSLRHDRDYLKP